MSKYLLKFSIIISDDDDFERVANDVRKLRRSVSMKKVKFEDDEYKIEKGDAFKLNKKNEKSIHNACVQDNRKESQTRKGAYF